MIKYKLAAVTALSVLMNLVVPQPVANDGAVCDLERLYWLCNDYQLPIKGYVVEGWFILPDRFGTVAMLERELSLKEGDYVKILPDDSRYSTSVKKKEQCYYIELQLITEQFTTAKEYALLWQQFVQRHRISQPIGATVIAELPEVLEMAAMQRWSEELSRSMEIKQPEQMAMERGYQMAGYSPQLSEYLNLEGRNINFNVVFQAQEYSSVLYLGTPVIYQRY